MSDTTTPDTWRVQAHLAFEIAAAHATRHVPIAALGDRVHDVRQSLVGQQYDSATHVVICEEGAFRGILRIEDLLAAPAEATVGELMDREAPVVGPGVDQEVAAWRAVEHAESALAVVDRDGRFAGLIPPHRLLAVLLWEHEEDLSRLGGFVQTTSMARRASGEPVAQRFVHRLPWLLLGFAGAMLAADIIGWFEATLNETVLIAFFVPGIVYLADAVGTQTETVVVRGLSVGVGLRRIAVRELLTGLAIGAALAIMALPVVWLRWGNWDVAVSVSLSLLAACSTATIAAMLLPWLLDRLGTDPAFGSGPLATVIQDLLSVVLYFTIATQVLR